MPLLILKVQAEKLLKSQIEKGKTLQEEINNCSSQNAFDKLNSKYYNWDNFNEDVLLKIFSSDKEKKEYRGASIGVFSLGERSLDDKVQEAIKDIEKNISKLEGMIERLELYDDGGAVATAAIKYDLNDLHPKIIESSARLFEDKHYAQAILEAFKQVNDFVKVKSGVHNKDGAPLMEYVFSPNNPILALSDLITQSDKDEQLGFMFLFKGAVIGVRNPKAHEIVVQRDSVKTLEYLAFASLLIKRTEDARKI
jgi:uncharacterized protein (TIGR02391 family)